MSRAVTYAGGISRIVAFGDDTPRVPEQFVESLQAEVARNESDSEEIVVDWKVEIGDEVELAEGPFKGMEGQVVEVRPGVERVSLLLEFLGGEKPVEVSLYSLILANPDIPEAWRGEK